MSLSRCFCGWRHCSCKMRPGRIFKSSASHWLTLECISQQALHSVMHETIAAHTVTFRCSLMDDEHSFQVSWIKAPVICAVFAIGTRCNISPVFTRMRRNSITNCAVCLLTCRTRCTRMRFNVYIISWQFPDLKCRIIVSVFSTVK